MPDQIIKAFQTLPVPVALLCVGALFAATAVLVLKRKPTIAAGLGAVFAVVLLGMGVLLLLRPLPAINGTMANWGNDKCGVPSNYILGYFKDFCDGRTTCEFAVQGDYLKDPAFGCQKHLEVRWNCGPGSPTRTTSIMDSEAHGHAPILISCLAGEDK